MSKAVTSHVPRGLAAGASLAVRPVTPIVASQSAGNQGKDNVSCLKVILYTWKELFVLNSNVYKVNRVKLRSHRN